MLSNECFVFLDNLQPITCDAGQALTLGREGWLLSASNTAPQMLALTNAVRAAGAILMSDNGNWSLAGEALKPFAAEIAALAEQAVPAEEQRQRLLFDILAEAQRVQARAEARGLWADQLSIGGTWLIGPEDLGMVALLRSGLVTEASHVDPLIADRWLQTRARFQALDRTAIGTAIPYLVLHAWDWPSAHALTAATTQANLAQAVAVSLGVAMRSRRWIDGIAGPGGRIEFAQRLPEKYLRAVALAHGTLSAMREPPRLHLLGAAAPILIAIFGLYAPYTEALSIDSAAPVLDAQDGWMYGNRGALLKMKREVLAARLLLRGDAYESADPFFNDFNERHPQDWPALRHALGVTGEQPESVVKAKLLSAPDLLREFAPYFAPVLSTQDPFCADLFRARCGANTWYLQQICRAVRARADQPVELRRWVSAEVARYAAVADPAWAAATRQALAFALQPLSLPRFRSPPPVPKSASPVRTRRLAELERCARSQRSTLLSDQATGASMGTWALALHDATSAAREYSMLSRRLGPNSVLESVSGALAACEKRIGATSAMSLNSAGILSRALARATYMELTEAWAAGRRLRDQRALPVGLDRKLVDLERERRALLIRVRRHAAGRDAAPVTLLAQRIVDWTARLQPACVEAAAAPSELQLGLQIPGLRASRLIRHAAFLTAAVPFLRARLGSERLADSTAELLTRRSQLERLDGPPLLGTRRLLRPVHGKTLQVRGVVQETGWVERPQKPFGWARTADGIVLVLPWKRFENLGAAAGTMVWAAGRVEENFATLGTVVKVEAEGMTQHADTVFADWLATELRDAIDLQPGSLRLWWELPDPRSPHAMNDLDSHVGPRARKISGAQP
ncbi:MAG: hypothetical protein WC213_01095 [Arenimonas sp.]